MNTFAIIILYSVGIVIMFQQSDYKLVHNHAELVSYNKTYARHVLFLNVKPNRTYRAYTAYFHLIKDLDGSDFKLHVILEAILNNVPKLKIAQFDLKVCWILNAKSFGTEQLFEASNLTACPLKRGHYGIEKFNLNDGGLPPNIPPGKYRLSLTFLDQTISIAHLYFFIDVVYAIEH